MLNYDRLGFDASGDSPTHPATLLDWGLGLRANGRSV